MNESFDGGAKRKLHGREDRVFAVGPFERGRPDGDCAINPKTKASETSPLSPIVFRERRRRPEAAREL
jgi:hypothetical protein